MVRRLQPSPGTSPSKNQLTETSTISELLAAGDDDALAVAAPGRAGLTYTGTCTLKWDGRDDEGRELASGVCLYRLHAGERVETRRMLLLK